MKKKIIIGVALFLAVVIGYTLYQQFLSTGPTMAKRDTEVKTNAQELFEAFESDESAANKQYLNKVLEIQGQVLSMKSSDTGKYYLELETMGFGVVKCTMEESFDPNGKDWSGEIIKVKGECLGYLLDVQIGEAIIIE